MDFDKGRARDGRIRRIVAWGLVWAFVVLGTAAPLLAQPSPCDPASRLLEARLLDAAQTALNKAAEEPAADGEPPPPCVAELTGQLAEAYKTRGDALANLGRDTVAQAAYVAAVQLDPGLAEELATELAQRRGPEADPFDPVRQLAALGELTQARTKLEELVKGDPPREVPEDLQFLHGGRWSWWRAVREWVYGWFPTVLELAAGLLLLGFLVWLVARCLRALERTDDDPWLRGAFLLGGLLLLLAGLESLVEACCLPGLSRWLAFLPVAGRWLAGLVGLWMVALAFFWKTIPAIRRKLIVEPIEGKVEGAPDASSLGATVCSRLLSLARSQEVPDIPLMTAAAESVSIPEVTSASPTTQGIAAVLEQLLKWLQIKPFTVTGTLHAPDRRGPGWTLHFQRKNRVLATTTLWQGTYALPGEADSEGDQGHYALLAELATVWILFQLKRHSRWPWQGELEILGTSDWQAFAFFQAGVWAFEADRLEESRYCFEMALQRDSKFPAAHFNLAKAIYYQEAGTKSALSRWHIAEALKLLTQGKDQPLSSRSPSWGERWLRLKEAAGLREMDRSGLAKGRDYFSPLYFKTAYAFLPYRYADLTRNNAGRSEADPRSEKADFLLELDRLSQELWAVAQAVDRGRELWLTTRPYAEALLPIVLTLEFELTSWSNDEAKQRLLCLEEHSQRGTALFCLNLAHLLTEYAEEASQQEDPGSGEEATRKRKTAVRCLARALRLHPTYIDEVRRSFQGKLGGIQEFKDLLGVAPPEEPDPPPPLATLKILGEAHARALAEDGIETLEELLLATAREKPRRHLARKLEVSRKLALRWTQLAELCRVRGLEIEAIDLLAEAGVGSLKALADLERDDMEELLGKLRESRGSELPFDVDDLVTWMDRANRLLPSMVEGGA